MSDPSEPCRRIPPRSAEVFTSLSRVDRTTGWGGAAATCVTVTCVTAACHRKWRLTLIIIPLLLTLDFIERGCTGGGGGVKHAARLLGNWLSSVNAPLTFFFLTWHSNDDSFNTLKMLFEINVSVECAHPCTRELKYTSGVNGL